MSHLANFNINSSSRKDILLTLHIVIYAAEKLCNSADRCLIHFVSLVFGKGVFLNNKIIYNYLGKKSNSVNSLYFLHPPNVNLNPNENDSSSTTNSLLS